MVYLRTSYIQKLLGLKIKTMIFAGAEQHTMVLDEAYTDRDALLTRLEADLDARVKRVDIKRVDMVKGTTTIDVRYKRG